MQLVWHVLKCLQGYCTSDMSTGRWVLTKEGRFMSCLYKSYMKCKGIMGYGLAWGLMMVTMDVGGAAEAPVQDPQTMPR